MDIIQFILSMFMCFTHWVNFVLLKNHEEVFRCDLHIPDQITFLFDCLQCYLESLFQLSHSRTLSFNLCHPTTTHHELYDYRGFLGQRASLKRSHPLPHEETATTKRSAVKTQTLVALRRWHSGWLLMEKHLDIEISLSSMKKTVHWLDIPTPWIAQNEACHNLFHSLLHASTFWNIKKLDLS